MWTKNGEASLPKALELIDKIIPHENVCCKILVDDNSTDRTTEIAKEYGWTVYSNPHHGVPSGANEALRHVDREFFASFEQDILLSPDWWNKIPQYMNDPQVGCAQGVRVSTEPLLRVFDEWQYANNPEKLWYSLDNNIFRTKTVRASGKFPEICPVCADSMLVERIQSLRFKWIVDMDVVSLHVRAGLKESVYHQYKHSALCARTHVSATEAKPSLKNMLKIFVTSPFRGIQIAVTRNCPDAIWAYPLLRFYYVDATLKFWREGYFDSVQ
jgi:glycosyltransferase involved in cell wall biosynthesis